MWEGRGVLKYIASSLLNLMLCSLNTVTTEVPDALGNLTESEEDLVISSFTEY